MIENMETYKKYHHSLLISFAAVIIFLYHQYWHWQQINVTIICTAASIVYTQAKWETSAKAKQQTRLIKDKRNMIRNIKDRQARQPLTLCYVQLFVLSVTIAWVSLLCLYYFFWLYHLVPTASGQCFKEYKKKTWQHKINESKLQNVSYEAIR